jgi:hypothetical protein
VFRNPFPLADPPWLKVSQRLEKDDSKKPLALFVRQKSECHRRNNASQCGEMIPSEFLTEIQKGKDAINRERDDFLNDFELEG